MTPNLLWLGVITTFAPVVAGLHSNCGVFAASAKSAVHTFVCGPQTAFAIVRSCFRSEAAARKEAASTNATAA
eukprot:CAMPEP_0171090588 /NCGR_PEP_ID=MMETSP0766_2-20121228/31950_1 /TAXON_ID=439317 /ORGANISM="Gambierdiscus australes, Strain CAWD 149" /LENGTH=72 /DNA_ID=CAMNT_0011548597 /DNA_START=222 /DNA_END=440 /DNA_ORIENTATION=+